MAKNKIKCVWIFCKCPEWSKESNIIFSPSCFLFHFTCSIVAPVDLLMNICIPLTSNHQIAFHKKIELSIYILVINWVFICLSWYGSAHFSWSLFCQRKNIFLEVTCFIMIYHFINSLLSVHANFRSMKSRYKLLG